MSTRNRGEEILPSNASANRDLLLEEWKAARTVLSDFDERLHDLRKYGFTFITALLTAESILIPGPVEAAFQQPAIPDNIKLAVILVTLLLLVGIRLMDKHYRLFLSAADIRAVIIERSLNIELSDAITFRFDVEKFSIYISVLYYLFGGATALLGVFILYPNKLVVFVLFGTLAYLYMIWRIDHLKNNVKLQDWTIDRLEAKRGEMVHITLTNLEKKAIVLNAGDVLWRILPQGERCVLCDVVYEEKSDRTITILGDDSYTWTLHTKNLEPGVYGVLPYNREQPLNRKITISPVSGRASRPRKSLARNRV